MFAKSKSTNNKFSQNNIQNNISDIQKHQHELTYDSLIQKYAYRLSTIQNKLNELCCQHDAYMPILSLVSSLTDINPCTKNGNIQCQKMCQNFDKLSCPTVSNFDRVQKEFHKNIEKLQNLKKKLEQYKIKIYIQLSQEKHQLAKQQRQIILQKTQQSLWTYKENLMDQLAIFKNQLLIDLKKQTITQQKQNINNWKQKNIPKFNNKIKNLHRQIGLIKCLKKKQWTNQIQLQKFNASNSSRIIYELQSINQILDNKIMNTYQGCIDFKQLKERYFQIVWQIKGSKKIFILNQNLILKSQQLRIKINDEMYKIQSISNNLKNKIEIIEQKNF